MSSPRTRCTHSSGRSVSRCASAGTATAFTSSGTTKSRPASAAFARESFISARLPRGLAPTASRRESRVAVDEVDDVALDRRGHVHLLERALHRDERRRVDDRVSGTSSSPRSSRRLEHLDLVLARLG